jgi:hypothetical protein
VPVISHETKTGRKLRRARNVVKRFESRGDTRDTKFYTRYCRAKALLLAAKLAEAS